MSLNFNSRSQYDVCVQEALCWFLRIMSLGRIFFSEVLLRLADANSKRRSFPRFSLIFGLRLNQILAAL